MKDEINSLSYDEKVIILEDYKKLHKNGSIGDCLLRRKASESSERLTGMVDVLYMDIFAKEVALNLASEYINVKKLEGESKLPSQRDIYNNIYNAKIFEFKLTHTDDKSSRLANMYAVKHTWELFNEQYRPRTS